MKTKIMIKIKWIKIYTLLLLLFPLIGLSQTNWTQLFNGKNFDGWEIKQGKADFEIFDDGVKEYAEKVRAFNSEVLTQKKEMFLVISVNLIRMSLDHGLVGFMINQEEVFFCIL